MTVYSKFCIICNTQFLTLRISTLFCSKNCANRSRNLPVSLKEKLVRRNSKFSMSMLNHVDRDGTINKRQIVEFDPLDRLKQQRKTSKTEESLLWERAAEQARARGIDPTARQKNTSVYVQKGLADPDMRNFKLAEDDTEIIENIDTGFGSHVLDEQMKSQIYELKEHEIPIVNVKEKEEQPQPQQGGLRKFGSLSGGKNGK